MRTIGLDWGEVRIGISVSDPLGITAQPLLTVDNDDKFIAKLRKIIDEYVPEEIVIGLPRQMNGQLGPAAFKVKEFASSISSQVPTKISFWDERFTTKIAQSALSEANVPIRKRKAFLDASSACVMLQSYIDSKKK